MVVSCSDSDPTQKPAARQGVPSRVSVRAPVMGVFGLHARVAVRFAEVASRFCCSIDVRHIDRIADGKSIFQLLTLCASRGVELEITAEGIDALPAVDALRGVIEHPWEEDP